MDKQGVLKDDIAFSCVDQVAWLGHDIVVGLRDDGNQEVKQDDQVSKNTDDPKCPSVVDVECSNAPVLANLGLPEGNIWGGFISNSVSEDLYTEHKECVDIWIVISSNFDASNSVEETNEQQEDHEKQQERENVDCNLEEKFDKQHILLVNSQEIHKFESCKE